MSERTLLLKKRLLEAAPEICVERARHLTESFRLSEGKPQVIRLAEAFDNILTKMSIFVGEGELIVGNRASKPKASPLFPETMNTWIGPQLDVLPTRFAQPFLVSAESKRELLDSILPYWRGRSVWDRALELMSRRTQKEIYKNVFIMRAEFSNGIGHFIPGHGSVVREGLLAARGRAEERLRSLEKSKNSEEGRNFLRAAIIAVDAAVAFASRFAGEAERLSRAESDPGRREELLRIASACRRVPALPARNFHEGVQAVWFNQLLTQIEDGGFAISVGRFDQLLYHLYAQDIRSGTLTRDQAQELVECFYLKLSSVVNCLDTLAVPAAGGPPVAQNLTIGGQNEKGDDATNELSEVCLDAMSAIRTSMPNLSVRVHAGTPDDFLLRACEAIAGGTMLALFNDEAIIPAMVNRGIPLEEARCYGIVGCVEPTAPEKTFGSTDSNLFNIAKCLELALRNGDGIDLLKERALLRSMSKRLTGGAGAKRRKTRGKTPGAMTPARSAARLLPVSHYFLDPALKLTPADHLRILRGYRLGPRTGRAERFASLDELIEAYRAQVRHFAGAMVCAMDACGRAHEERKPTPYISSTIQDCIENAEDVTSGGARYNSTGPQAIGVANVADSLAAAGKFVFDEKLFTMGELVKILDYNYAGHESVRQTLLNRAPRYGNDDDGADTLARAAAEIYCREVEKHLNWRGGHFSPGIYSITGHITFGAITGALPDGRKAGEPLAEGVSPRRGAERSGPTAVLNSAAKLNYSLVSNGAVLNLKFHPGLLSRGENIRKFAHMNRAYFQRGGMHVQYNVVDAETLRDAQRRPGMYRDLVVRVAGYSALFTELDPLSQDDIIRRTEHTAP
ncbi:MAG: pyruvate formate lyase family protein [bacterium]